MRSTPLLLALVGCGRIGFADQPAEPDGGQRDVQACGLVATPAASTLADDFSDGTLGPAWSTGTSCIDEVGDELVARPAANAANYCVAHSVGTYHLDCSSITMHVAETTAPVSGAQTGLYIYGASETAYILADAGRFLLTPTTSGPRTYLPYDPVADAWWRVSADPTTIVLETSPDGVAWNRRGSIGSAFSLDQVTFGLAAGTYKPVANPGVARFRCFNTPPPCE